jgi:adhesin transport system membrane fusion protein
MVNFRYKEEGSDVDFMPDVLAAEKLKEKRLAPLLLYTTAVAIIALVIWAALSPIDELTRGEGKIIPSSLVQKVNHLEGGIIRKIFVHDGDVVKKGQVLLQIDNTIAQARYNEGKTLYYRQLAAVARLRAQINGHPLIIPEEVKKNAPLEAEDALRSYKSRMDALQNEMRIASESTAQKEQELNEQVTREKEARHQLELITHKLQILEPLVKKKLEPEINLIDLQKEASQVRSDLGSLKARIIQAQSALAETKHKQQQVPIKFQEEDWNALREASNKLANAQESFITERDRSTRTEVRSPIRGIIKQLHVTSIGEVIQPGGALMEIVPLEDTLLIEAKVNPRDIAFLRPGLTASVKISAYDYSIYGDLKAELIRISADSITEKDGNKDSTYYLVYLRTQGTKLSKSKKNLPLTPGMTVTVDILTGKKSVLTYLLKPIIKARHEALTER